MVPICGEDAIEHTSAGAALLKCGELLPILQFVLRLPAVAPHSRAAATTQTDDESSLVIVIGSASATPHPKVSLIFPGVDMVEALDALNLHADRYCLDHLTEFGRVVDRKGRTEKGPIVRREPKADKRHFRRNFYYGGTV